MTKANQKILLIEDDPDQVYLYSVKFEQEGLSLITATNGAEGLALAKKEKPALILLDIVMEEMDGLEVLAKLKRSQETKNIPVVLLTNLVKKELLEKSKKMGAVGFWPKTEVLPQDVVERSKRILKT